MNTNGKFKLNKLQFNNITLEEDDNALKVFNTETQESISIGTSQNIDYRELYNPNTAGIVVDPDSYYTVNNDIVTMFVSCTVNNNYFNKYVMMQLPILAKSVSTGNIHIQDAQNEDISTNFGSVYIDDSKFFLTVKSNLIDASIMESVILTFNIT